MTERFALYYAPAADSVLWQRAQEWLVQPDLTDLTGSARRYGFHATLKAPMVLADGTDRAALEMAAARFANAHGPVSLGGLAPRMLDGFVALTSVPQPRELTDLAATVVTDFEPFREPLDATERERRLKAPLSARQIALVDAYGYPYVLEQFLFHMTITDRLPAERVDELLARAAQWFGPVLSAAPVLDRIVLFHEAGPGEPFVRLDDFVLRG